MTTSVDLSNISRDHQEATIQSSKQAIHVFTLGRIEELQDIWVEFESSLSDSTFKYNSQDGTRSSPNKTSTKGKKKGKKKEKPRAWDSYENQISNEPKRNLTHPVTVMKGAGIALAQLSAAIAAAITQSVPDHVFTSENIVDELRKCDTKSSPTVRMIVDVTRNVHVQKCINTANMKRDFDFVKIFKVKFRALIGKEITELGKENLARLYVDFLRFVAWNCANSAWETKNGQKFTLNGEHLMSIIRSFGPYCQSKDLEIALTEMKMAMSSFCPTKTKFTGRKPNWKPRNRGPDTDAEIGNGIGNGIIDHNTPKQEGKPLKNNND